ncbi:MAG TPA: transposase [Acidobacteriaceae bacterium]
MPPRLERRQQTNNLHFITFSCHGRNPYLSTPRAACIFEHALESTRQKYQFHVLGYVVMPEHVHLLLSEPPTHPLSTVLGALKRSVSKQLPQRPFWLPRYHDFNVFSEEKRIEKLHYLHRNPVNRGLSLKPEDYPCPASTPTPPTPSAQSTSPCNATGAP